MRDLHDQAVIVGVRGHGRAARVVARGLRASSHRVRAGAAGLVAFGDGGVVRTRREATRTFLADEVALEALSGVTALGALHARRDDPDAAAGLTDGVPVPAVARVGEHQVTIALSGEVAAAMRLRRDLLDGGAALQGDAPEELLVHLLARSRQRTLVNRLVDALWRAEGGYALLLATSTMLVGLRDARGLRPLVLGEVEGAPMLASTAAALYAAGGRFVRALAPGEMVIVDDQGVASVTPFRRQDPAPCAQEILQLADPAHGGEPDPWSFRQGCGEELAREAGAPVDVVVPAGPAAHAAASAYAGRLGVPLLPLLGDTDAPVPVAPLAGRSVALVAMSASDALGPSVQRLLAAGVVDVHVRAAAPRRVRDCPYGVRGTEIAGEGDGDALAQRLGAASLGVLSRARLGALLKAAGLEGACTACVGGDLPLAAPAEAEQLPLFAQASGD